MGDADRECGSVYFCGDDDRAGNCGIGQGQFHGDLAAGAGGSAGARGADLFVRVGVARGRRWLTVSADGDDCGASAARLFFALVGAAACAGDVDFAHRGLLVGGGAGGGDDGGGVGVVGVVRG